MSGARRSFKNDSQGVVAFAPTQIAAVAAGYFWDPAAATGSGTAQFLLPEGNGKTTHDMITPSAGAAPSTATVNGQAVAAYANGVPDRLARTSVVRQRGWTGATMIWGWVSCASGAGSAWGHWRTANNLLCQINGGDVRFLANDGATQEARFPLPPAGYAAGPVYYEFVFDPSVAATARLQVFFDRVQQTPNVAATMGTTLADTAEFLTFGGTTSDSTINNYVADFSCGVFGITNGIPTSTERDALFAYKKLK